MTRARIFLAAALVAVGALFSAGVVAGDLEIMMLAQVAAAPAAAARAANPRWTRREPMKSFTNVDANKTAFVKIPRYVRSIRALALQLGGTTFTKALISRIELFLGSKSIWGPASGTDLRRVNQYVNALDDNDKFLNLDFTFPNVKEQSFEQSGGLDLSVLPEGELTLEVDIGAAVAPTLKGHIVWGNPDGNPMMQKLVKRTYPAAAAGDFFPDVQMRGAIVCRQFLSYTVIAAATTTAHAGNTGNGAMGAVTVTAGTRCGVYKLKIIEPAANAGTFVVFDPDGVVVSQGTVAVAFSAGGLAFTLADGAADFVAGDGFDIEVGAASFNLNAVEVKKNEEVWWSRDDLVARYEQRRHGRNTLAGIYVVDFLLDNHGDGRLHTSNARALDYKLNLTAADTVTLVSQVLARPLQI